MGGGSLRRNAWRAADSGRQLPLLGPAATRRLVVALLPLDALLLVSQLDASDWRSLPLLAVLVSFACMCELGSARLGTMTVSSSFLALVLAMVLLGPVPAAVVGLSTIVVDRFACGKSLRAVINNGFVYTTVALLGGIAIEALVGNDPTPDASGRLAVAVFGVSLAAGALNFFLIAGLMRAESGASIRLAIRETYLPAQPYMLVAATLAAAAAHMHTTVGLPMLSGVVVVLLVSELLLRSVASARARAADVIALTRQRAELVEDALMGEEAERAWLAAHLHDETLQVLAVAEQDLEAAGSGDPAALGRAREEIAAAIAELRRTLTHFHPASIATVGYERALIEYAGQLGRRSGAACRIDVEPGASPHHDALLYSVGRELLANAAKHAHATEIVLRIGRAGDLLTMTVTDDGRGFDAGARPRLGHVGLAAAVHRVEATGGQLMVASAPGRGTTVDVTIPAVRPAIADRAAVI